jgi:hypothetical protein
MSEPENYETTFNHFLLHFLRYLCNFCPNTCSQEAKLMKWSHLGVVTLDGAKAFSSSDNRWSLKKKKTYINPNPQPERAD